VKDIGAIALDSYEDPLELLRQDVGGRFAGMDPIYLLQDPGDPMIVYHCTEPFDIDDVREVMGEDMTLPSLPY
jgi:hypothetical protein